MIAESFTSGCVLLPMGAENLPTADLAHSTDRRKTDYAQAYVCCVRKKQLSYQGGT